MHGFQGYQCILHCDSEKSFHSASPSHDFNIYIIFLFLAFQFLDYLVRPSNICSFSHFNPLYFFLPMNLANPKDELEDF